MKALRTLLLILAGGALLVIAGCSLLPGILHTLNPSVTYRIPDAGRTLYLTLDDGPSAATGQILTVLRKHDVHATFFITTDHIQPDLMRDILAGGHQLANHLKTTTSQSKLSEIQFQTDFLASDKALSSYAHVKLFRPPGGSISTERAQYVTSQGYSIVVGTVFPLDHWLESKRAVKSLAEALVINGGIVILHDTSERGPRSAVVLDELIPDLKAKGYSFALLPEPTK